MQRQAFINSKRYFINSKFYSFSRTLLFSMLSGLPSCKDRLLWQEKDLHLDKDKASCTAREVLLLRGLILWGKRMQLSSLCELSYDATLICLHNCLLKLNVSEYTMDNFPATLIKQFYF